MSRLRSKAWLAPYHPLLRTSLVCLGLSSLSAAPVQADPPVLGGGGISSVLAPLDSMTGIYTDVIFGRNLKGPYLLSWKGIRPSSDVVTRDGLDLKRDTDYTFDPVAGTISFSAPLSSSQIVRVIYSANTIDSKPNTSNLSLPLQWILWNQNKASLTFNSIYTPDATGVNSATGLITNLQFKDTTQLARTSNLSSGLFVDLHGGDWLARSGAKFVEDTKFRNGDIGASYSYAGALFNQGAATGLTAGKEILQANALLTPYKFLKLTSLVRETDTIADPAQLVPGAIAGGTQTLETVNALSLTLPQKGKLDASRGVTTVTDPTGGSVTTTSDAVKVQRQIVPGTQATVSYDAQTVIATSPTLGEEKDEGTYTQKSSLVIKSAPTKQITVTGTFKNILGGANAGDTDSLHIEATPIAKLKQLKLTTGFEDTYQDSGVQHKREALVDLPTVPAGKTQVSGGVQQLLNSGKEQYVEILTAKSNPLRYFQLDGGAKLRQGYLADSAIDPDIVNTYNMKVSVAPSRFLKLTGNVSHNPEKDSGEIQKLIKQTVGLESDLGLFLLKSQYGTENDYALAKSNSLLTLGVDLRLSKRDTLSTGFEGRSAQDLNLTSSNTFKLGYTHKIGSTVDLNLSGSYTQNLLNGIPTSDRPDLKAEAKVGVKF